MTAIIKNGAYLSRPVLLGGPLLLGRSQRSIRLKMRVAFPLTG